MKVQGKIIKIFDTHVVSDNFKKRDFVLEIKNESPYVQKVLFTAINNRTDVLNGYGVDQEVEVEFNLNGKEWNAPNGEVKYFNTIVMNTIEAMTDAPNYAPNPNHSDADLQTQVNVSNDEDDLPF